jgi:hypothetical protein
MPGGWGHGCSYRSALSLRIRWWFVDKFVENRYS